MALLQTIIAPMASPLLFGGSENQDLLVRLFREGQWRKPAAYHVPAALRRSGLIAQVGIGAKASLVLDSRHPTYELFHEVLAQIAGCPASPVLVSPKPRSEHSIDLTRPLGHRSPFAFRVIRYLSTHGDTSTETLKLLLVHVTRTQVEVVVQRLVEEGVVEREGSRLAIARAVPTSYGDLVAQLGTILEKRDRRLRMDVAAVVPRVAAFTAAVDGAPLLFGTDVRLRNLMALAKYGPMYVRDLRRLSGVSVLSAEGSNVAPFGRGGLVRTWQTSRGPVVEIDPAYPLRFALRRLLLRLEELYPLPPYIASCQIPVSPDPRKWVGDQYALFGGEIVTTILVNIGVLGWTFEALCVATCIGYDRVVVKKALKKLEAMGILTGERNPRPGFNVRVIRLADSCPAGTELYALLQACRDVFPIFADRVHAAMKYLSPRTKEHLRRRGLIERTSNTARKRKWKELSDAERRADCLQRYCALATSWACEVTSHELSRSNSTLYLRIRRCWGSFAAFRAEAGLSPTFTGITTKPNQTLRDRCIDRYCHLAARTGYQPNTADLYRLDRRLYDWIRIQWGGFPQFCDDLRFSPAHRRRSAKTNEATRRNECQDEYRMLKERIGRAPLVSEMRRLAPGLYTRIRKLRGGIAAFREQIG